MTYYRHRFVFFALKPFFRFFLKLRYNYTPVKFKGKKRPYLILSNHVCTMDPFMVSLSFRAPIYFVASDHLLRKGWISKVITFLVEPIGKLKAASDLVTIKNMMKKLRQNKNVCLFPEGNRTFNGMTGYIAPSVGKFIKACHADVLFYTLEKGYLADPRWADHIRKGKLTGSVKSILTIDECENMTVDEIVDIVKKELNVNPTPKQDKNRIAFKGSHLAEHIERAVFLCPVCYQVATLHTNGAHGTCENCGMDFNFLSTGYLAGKKLPFETIYEWDEWQREFIQTHLFEDGELICENINERLYLISRSRKNELIGVGTLKLYTDRLEFIIEDSNEIYEFSFESIENMNVHGRQVLQFGVENKDFYELKNNAVRSAVKYMYFFYFYKQHAKGGFDGFFGI